MTDSAGVNNQRRGRRLWHAVAIVGCLSIGTSAAFAADGPSTTSGNRASSSTAVGETTTTTVPCVSPVATSTTSTSSTTTTPTTTTQPATVVPTVAESTAVSAASGTNESTTSTTTAVTTTTATTAVTTTTATNSASTLPGKTVYTGPSTTIDPLAPTTKLPVDPCDPDKYADAIAEAPPIATNPVVSTLPQVAVVNPEVSSALLKKAKVNLQNALAAREVSAHNVIAMQERYRLLGVERTTADSAILALQHKVEEAKQVYIDRSVMSYVRGSSIEVNSTLDATSPLQAQSRRTMFGAILDGDHRALEVYRAALVGVEEARRAMFDTSRHVSRQVQMLRIQLADEDKFLGVLHQTVLSLEAGGEVAVDGFVFPVAGEHSFTDTFGAPRMIGTPFAHVHQGTDIDCELGTALVASETGIIEKVWVNPLGGNSIWLAGTSGTYYYYAHLSEFAVGLHEQQRVKGGEVVGYCGITGNAEGPHLHFEIHPGGGIAINPYPILRIADEVSARVAAGLPPYELGGLAPSIKDAITGVTTTVVGQTTTTVSNTKAAP